VEDESNNLVKKIAFFLNLNFGIYACPFLFVKVTVLVKDDFWRLFS